MMGMSSPEWSRYMHEVIGAPGAARGDQPRGRPADGSAAIASACRSMPGAREAVERLAARWPLGLASSSNRELIDLALELMGIAEHCHGHRLVGGGRPRQAGTRRLPRGGAAARSRPRAGGRGRGLRRTGSSRPRRPGCASIAIPNRHFPPGEAALARADVVLHSLAELDPGGRRALIGGAADEHAGVVAAEAHRVRERHVDLRFAAPRSARSRGRTPDRGSRS